MTTEPTWRKASFSADTGNCVELSPLDEHSVGIRDSKLGDTSPVLTLSRGQLAHLLDAIKTG